MHQATAFSGAVAGELKKKKKLLHQLYFPPSTWHHKTASNEHLLGGCVLLFKCLLS
jgi:hypothetical protein